MTKPKMGYETKLSAIFELWQSENDAIYIQKSGVCGYCSVWSICAGSLERIPTREGQPAATGPGGCGGWGGWGWQATTTTKIIRNVSATNKDALAKPDFDYTVNDN
ncbi:hypothetical protein PPTG_23799 [Phytophthora nicotianae INRA-310]|uniref:Uncharacterized protein n=1 Tax=Phytophthora nicotianae (strain INRA-310) TaxID=761204 RepID=W2PRJ5_PHYN3|nr:hypothetical protein PPTG_23799 [Phytophthora nicotianae INRA-310]ETN03547.1 hypothetical protein PPTG_23799 [Phytophthora nicotianae INRA-310]